MKFSGVFAPIPTPFTADENVDIERLRAALRAWTKRPLAGFVLLGSTGEAVLLGDDEADHVVSSARDVVPRSLKIIVGTGRESTRGAVRASKRAAELGADAVLVRTPGFYKSRMTADAFVRHYSVVADASPVPVLLYNFPAVTGVNLPPEAVARLAAHPNIAGMKDSSGDLSQMAQIVSSTPDTFEMLTGSATTFHAALCVGAVGGVLALSCLLPDACARLYDLALAGQHDEARALQQRLVPIARLVGSTYGVPGLKAALALVGCDVGVPRSPLLPVPERAVAELGDALATFEEADRRPAAGHRPMHA